MKNIFLLILILFSSEMTAQIFGNTVHDSNGGYQGSHILWIKIITGPDDSGFFTHYGIYDHPTYSSTCAIKFSIYSDHATLDRPENKLVDDYLASPINGVWNEHPVDPQVAIEPNTTYWIGLRFPCTYGSGREIGVNWANQPLKYYDSWSFNSNWPDPASGGSMNTWGSLQNVALYLVGNNMTLPVDLISFELNKRKDKVELTWKVANEINNDGWNVQRSENGFTWNTIGHVSGRGDARSEEEYTFVDTDKHSGLIFYRLQQVDLDGQTAYSEVRSIDMYRSKFTVYPTLLDQYLTVDGVEEDSEYQIFSNSQVVQKGRISRGERIDVSQLNSGMHYITINGEPLKIVKL